jgi:hypothetical protein
VEPLHAESHCLQPQRHHTHYGCAYINDLDDHLLRILLLQISTFLPIFKSSFKSPPFLLRFSLYYLTYSRPQTIRILSLHPGRSSNQSPGHAKFRSILITLLLSSEHLEHTGMRRLPTSHRNSFGLMLWKVSIKFSTKNERLDGKINGSEDFKVQELVSGTEHIGMHIHKIPIHRLLKIQRRGGGGGEA